MIPEEVTVGPFTFAYDVDKHEIYVSNSGETHGMIDSVSADMWKQFTEYLWGEKLIADPTGAAESE